MTKLKLLPFVMVVLGLMPVETMAGAPHGAELRLVRVRKLHDNAFYGDIIAWHGTMLVTFRDSNTHEGPGGKVAVLESRDEGATWRRTATLEKPEFSLFDPHFCALADGRLALHGGIRDNAGRHWRSYVAFSNDGIKWMEPRAILDQDQWLWRLTAHQDGSAYGIVYGCPPGKKFSQLLRTKDAVQFEPVTSLLTADYPNEATIRFAPDETACIVHRVEERSGHALLGVGRPPYRDWKWMDLGRFVGGPNLLLLPSGKWLVGGRCVEKPVRLQLGTVDITAGKYQPLLDLPSGGDCSYPGFLLHKGKLWVTYYSSHEGPTSVYLAELTLPDPSAR
jgi:hypothetical protein